MDEDEDAELIRDDDAEDDDYTDSDDSAWPRPESSAAPSTTTTSTTTTTTTTVRFNYYMVHLRTEILVDMLPKEDNEFHMINVR